LENYWSAMGKYQGKSLNKYNSSNGIWEQFWIDNGGNTLKLAGGLNSGNMVLENKRETKDGPLQNKITWEKLEKGNVRQTWEVSKDGGNTWKTVFDGLYVGHKLKNGEMRK